MCPCPRPRSIWKSIFSITPACGPIWTGWWSRAGRTALCPPCTGGGWLPELKSSNFNTRSFGERVALNMPIQGTAADIIKLAMIKVDARLRAEGLEARLILQVHDELIVECPEGEAEQVRALLQEEMEGVAALAVPLVADAKAGRTWAQCH